MASSGKSENFGCKELKDGDIVINPSKAQEYINNMRSYLAKKKEEENQDIAMRKELKEVSSKNKKVLHKIGQVKEVIQEVHDDIKPLRVANELQLKELHPKILQMKSEITIVEARVQEKTLLSKSLDEEIIKKQQRVDNWQKDEEVLRRNLMRERRDLEGILKQKQEQLRTLSAQK
jgi:chromosome segregation ATPase